MTEIYYMRHGETTANMERICAGHTDVDLTGEGVKQARRAGKEIVAKKLSFDLIVSSPLKRALDTAILVAKEIGYPPDDILVDDIFIERYRGNLEGKSTRLQNGMSNDDLIREGAEDEKALAARAQSAVRRMLDKRVESLLVVGHNSFGKYFIAAVNGSNPKEVEKLPNAHILKVGIMCRSS